MSNNIQLQIILHKYWITNNKKKVIHKMSRRGLGYSAADDFMKLYATAQVRLRNVYGASCSINNAQVELHSCVKFA